ncbi:hypothetical protein GLOTRDRAFT_128242 [Gloeophyllum trabeum ATCC 11539]|uniref:RING-type domain-containing protein n=1 Tax=Gloeophyllum trabeum (strain ATCC 11539 / FP-39264 / Madison 617) TaxID=670483 RepID=S7QA42_GLOTA|nr:uncharacterized protein GLOTRDRAFT_128242 [Gloeophyllum trabeum ATCC 11539]EPQ56781.1 hypothetical protein GLOTRDRAFT_128242 [Gloeophyllum trabeum ATCC 11539]
MFSCIICLDTLKSPVALPCGHVFCCACIERIVTTIKPFTSQHCCPSCRRPYSISTIDPSMIPSHLHQHIFPPIRKLYLDLSPTLPRPSTSSQSQTHLAAPTEGETAKAENLALRAHVEMWKRRAEVHSAANLGLVNLAKMARDYAVGVKRERDALEREMAELRRRLGGSAKEKEKEAEGDSDSASTSPPPATPPPLPVAVKHEQPDILLPPESLLATVPPLDIPIPRTSESALPTPSTTPTSITPDESEERPRKRSRRSTPAEATCGPRVQHVRRSSRHQRCTRTPQLQVCQ